MHLVPTTFDLQVHSPIALHDVIEDPEELHPHAEKNDNILNIFSKSCVLNELIFTLAEGKSIKTRLTSCTFGTNNM